MRTVIQILLLGMSPRMVATHSMTKTAVMTMEVLQGMETPIAATAVMMLSGRVTVTMDWETWETSMLTRFQQRLRLCLVESALITSATQQKVLSQRP